jgi:hypothetical protein
VIWRFLMAAVEQMFDDDYADREVQPQATQEDPMAKSNKPIASKKTTTKPGAGKKKGGMGKNC